ncbi:hypothetical protein GLAREA_04982 [Glarea lozoyensis ATCC 20868]|uniref:Uncharacterized protein n=1 Tax=Glarea lozoyensis (strain ATCC 20868 / MF5171) TaxID=1116229 RepID=S3D851_GLAL2|nr:uncharacterized protein GLAREA_04982 [Glarea lozoyensis ATCC 20868]EPE28191.1 hypothetical protein GLAREA_04982 [Glarea lozoyensis ATCC 20868]
MQYSFSFSQLVTLGLLVSVPLASAYPTATGSDIAARDLPVVARHHTEAQIAAKKNKNGRDVEAIEARHHTGKYHF